MLQNKGVSEATSFIMPGFVTKADSRQYSSSTLPESQLEENGLALPTSLKPKQFTLAEGLILILAIGYLLRVFQHTAQKQDFSS